MITIYKIGISNYNDKIVIITIRLLIEQRVVGYFNKEKTHSEKSKVVKGQNTKPLKLWNCENSGCSDRHLENISSKASSWGKSNLGKGKNM